MVWGLAGCIFVVYLVSFCLILFQCRPVRYVELKTVITLPRIDRPSGLWNRQAPGVKCVNINVQTVTIVVHGSFGVIFDVILLGTPIWIIYHKMIRTSTTIKVIYYNKIHKKETNNLGYARVLHRNIFHHYEYDSTQVHKHFQPQWRFVCSHPKPWLNQPLTEQQYSGYRRVYHLVRS